MIKTLQLKAKHFIGTNYVDPDNCAISKAVKEQFGEVSKITTGVCDVRFNYQNYDFRFENGEGLYDGRGYGAAMFESDAAKAYGLEDGDAVIRTIKLIPSN
jgi:hypothetical protein